MERLLSGLGNLLAALRKGHGASQGMEFTVEANPESVDEEFLHVCRDGGVNRISLGVQSFYEPSLRTVHRSGFQNSALTEEKLALVSRAFPNGFSLDLISGLPLQNREILLSDIKKALAFEPSHVSLYSLSLEDGRALPGMLGRDEADSLWLAGRDSLVEAGFPQYEVSNFAKQEKRSLHNIRYWRMENWLGLGPAASGTVIDDKTGTGRRYTIMADIDKWLAHEAVVQEEFLDAPVLMRESLLMGSRYIEGPDPALFEKRFGIGIGDAIPKTLDRWRGKGFLARDKIALNRNGLAFLNSFLVEAFGELERGQILNACPQ
jgi:oxygen-independent coproporphyrinogen-3 oxidase